MAIFPGAPAAAADTWSYKSWKAPVNSSPSTNQHPAVYRPDALSVTQLTVSKHWRKQKHLNNFKTLQTIS